ncbi:regulatory protein ral2 [Sparassis latifolia]
MYPISDLTAFCRRTTGDVPPKLVGASTTVVGSKMYLYGGRLVQERRMVSDIYMFDLESFNWERLVQDPEDDIPQARYFHSADTWNNHLIIFGGMAIKPQSDNPEDLCVLNDVRLFDLSSGHWLPSSSTVGDPTFVPNARYAHLSSVTGDRLFIIGGQDLANVWLDDVYIYDLVAKSWVQRRDYSRHCGTYRSVAVTADMRVRLPQEEMQAGESLSSKLGPPGARFKTDKTPSSTAPITQPDSLIHLPYSASPTDDYPCDIFLFSNYNFTDVQRELEVFTPLPDYDFAVSDRSAAMSGTYFPPGLRFPTGAILGTFFIVAGTYLSQQYQSFSIWALDLINMNWSRIDPGSALASGSWFRGCLWPAMNKFMVFGNRHGSIVEDYNRRLLSWDHVTCIDLEAFGIYQPPALRLEIPMQELGLAALEEGVLTDFEIVCDDDRRIACSRKMLEDRWPWFKEQRKLFALAATQTTEMMPSIAQHVPVPDLRGIPDKEELRPDPRLTPRAFHLSEPYPVTLALVQYFYTTALITPVQHAPAVLSQLLLLSSTYQLPHLQDLVKHAMHRALSYATSVGIYGVSTLCNCRSLQIRSVSLICPHTSVDDPLIISEHCVW